jgi:protein gp37
MNHTKIEWVKNQDGTHGYTINPVKGLCPMACTYCYARRMYKRYKWDETIRMEPDWVEDLPKKPSRVFVGSTMELFGDWVEDWMWDSIWAYVNDYPQHTFIFLTKQPHNLIKWSPFPPNCCVGVSATNDVMFHNAVSQLALVNASVKFISCEPLLSSMNVAWVNPDVIQWLIIGQQTPVSKKTEPKVEWIKEIVEAADNAGIPVFLKDNLRTLLIPEDCGNPNALMVDNLWESDKAKLRQELPR